MVGTFYWAKMEQSDEVVARIGRKVQKNQVLGRIKALGLYTDVLSPIDGKIIGFLLLDDMPVEYGQLILLIEEL
jgi:biotin carboxyl carrier protein